MSFRNGGVKLAHRAARQVETPVVILPAFLCPGILKIGPASQASRCFQSRRHLHTEAAQNQELLFSRPLASVLELNLASKLPVQCPGCGALSQVVEQDDPGFYSLTRGTVKAYFQGQSGSKRSRERQNLERLRALEAAEASADEYKGIIGESNSASTHTNDPTQSSTLIESPVCDRCHSLKHHDTGVSIHHPSIQSIQDTIFESPHKYNHIYHIVDAADFPMSLVPGLHRLLHLTPQRSLNRRSQTGKFYHGRKTEISFIITRSDLLGPTEKHVNKLMPYLTDVLRDALGRAAQDARLGNVRCVSAKRQWWTKELKEEIWHRGAGGWMVGKVNVGKSQLFQEVFPKGRMGDWSRHTTLSTSIGRKMLKLAGKPVTGNDIPELVGMTPKLADSASVPSENVENEVQEAEMEPLEEALELDVEVESSTDEVQVQEQESLETEGSDPYTEPLNTGSLLPPLPIEISYPVMPLVSALPGTTASPIRVPFGNSKGELIDLPGLSRGDLEQHVQPEHRSCLVMRARVTPVQHVLKPWQSLLLGGFIRITAKTPDVHILAYNFTPIQEHRTSTEKAIEYQTGPRKETILNISVPGTEEKIASAGKFYLKYDVTKARTGPITRKDAAGIRVDRLPYRVLGTDILIEGVGWVELAAQVRKPYGYLDHKDDSGIDKTEEQEIDPSWPEIEVFTPGGRFVGQRRPLNAWLMLGDKPGATRKDARPRMAMKGAKKTEKMRSREVKRPM